MAQETEGTAALPLAPISITGTGLKHQTFDVAARGPANSIEMESELTETSESAVLLVDDDENLVAALERNLAFIFNISTCTSPIEAVKLVGDTDFAVVVSDLQMPMMTGIELFRRLHATCPDTVRILLTGNADLQSAIEAVNDGHVFRFLTKPADEAELERVIRAGIRQHELIRAERELLEKTLKGSVQALLDTLSLANPVAFSRATRIQKLVAELGSELDLENKWEVEVAAMLAQVGSVTLPQHVIDKLDAGQPLDPDQKRLVAQLPALADSLLAGIPRLEGVRAIIAGQRNWKQNESPIGSKVIQFASEIDRLEAAGIPFPNIVSTLEADEASYGIQLLGALRSFGSQQSAHAARAREVALQDLEPGMVLLSDIRVEDGSMLVGRGHAVTANSLARIRNFADQIPGRSVRVEEAATRH